jgi:transcriptional regulator with XRE-family HTH domain
MTSLDNHERRRDTGRRVAYWRNRRGLTRQAFADLVGRSISWVDKIESGERGLVRLPMLEQVADVLRVSVDTLTGTADRRQAARGRDTFEVAALRTALQSYQAISRVFGTSGELVEPPSLDGLDQRVTYAWMAFQNGHWPRLGQTLPELLTIAQAATNAYSGDDDNGVRARTLLSQAYQVTASTLWKLKEVDLAWLAAERGLVLAEQTGDSLLISDAARRVAQGLMTMEHHEQALGLLKADISRLEPGRGSGSPAYLSLYGMLFLMGSVVAAKMHNTVLARELLAEGQSVADQLGRDGNERFTAFGPTNVRLHQVSVLADLGDGSGAVAAARRISPDGLGQLPKERRANCYLDVARIHVEMGQRDDAVRVLLDADRLFPDEVRHRPVATSLVDELWRFGTPSSELERLASRVGLVSRG